MSKLSNTSTTHLRGRLANLPPDRDLTLIRLDRRFMVLFLCSTRVDLLTVLLVLFKWFYSNGFIQMVLFKWFDWLDDQLINWLIKIVSNNHKSSQNKIKKRKKLSATIYEFKRIVTDDVKASFLETGIDFIYSDFASVTYFITRLVLISHLFHCIAWC